MRGIRSPEVALLHRGLACQAARHELRALLGDADVIVLASLPRNVCRVGTMTADGDGEVRWRGYVNVPADAAVWWPVDPILRLSA